MSKKVKFFTAMALLLIFLLMSGIALAADPNGGATGSAKDLASAVAGQKVTLQSLADEVGHNKVAVNFVFVIFGMSIIFFMQAGFALVETGFCRAKNAAHVIMTNFVIFAIGTVGYFMLGFALQFGGVGQLGTLGGVVNLDHMVSIAKGWGIFGTKGIFGNGIYDVGIMAFFLFQLVFMDTAATIVTGAMAERWKFSAFVVFGFFMSMILYPLFGNWVWGGGWLSQLGNNLHLGNGYLDFAGSSVVHAMGGITALAGAIVIGPRIGKFNKDGSPNAIPGHHIPMAILGTIILWFGWIGFNGASTLAGGDLRLSIIIANTFLAGSTGALAAMFLMWKIFGKPDASMTANGALAGLVAITAPCAFVAPWAALLIGVVAGLLVVGSVLFVERVLKIDDPVGAISVHGANGLWGVISLGIFADGTYGSGFNGISHAVTGLLYGGTGQFVAQLIGAGTIFATAFGIGYVFFKVQDMVQGIRVSPEAELQGVDLAEIGALAYPDFAGSTQDWMSPDSTGLGLPPGKMAPAPGLLSKEVTS